MSTPPRSTPRLAEQVIKLTEQVVRQQDLTTLMVTHSMAHAVSLGDRLLMAHQGRIIYDVSAPPSTACVPTIYSKSSRSSVAPTSSMKPRQLCSVRSMSETCLNGLA